MTFVVNLIVCLSGCCPFFETVSALTRLGCPPRDLFEPILVNEFSFDKRGYSEDFSLSTKHRDYVYEVLMTRNNGRLPREFRFGATLRIQFFHAGKLLREEIVKPPRGWIGTYDEPRYVVLTEFDLFRNREYMGVLRMRLEVVTPEYNIDHSEGVWQVVVQVSGRK